MTTFHLRKHAAAAAADDDDDDDDDESGFAPALSQQRSGAVLIGPSCIHLQRLQHVFAVARMPG